MVKQHQRLFLTLVCALCALGCFPRLAEAAEKELRILATTFPIYQITRNVVNQAENVRVELMIPAASGCPHDYSLTPQDMQKLLRADVLVINGLKMEKFLDAALKQAPRSLKVVDSSLGLSSGLQIVKKKDHGDHNHRRTNPHLFVSPAMNAWLADSIAEQLAGLDPENATIYQHNAGNYSERLQDLAAEFQAFGASLPNKTIVTQYELFDYLVRDMDLQIVTNIYAHEGTDPSAARLLKLARHIKKEKAAALLVEPHYADTIGATMARETGLPLLVLDPVGSGPEDADLDYFEQVMEANLQSLEQTLGRK